MSVPQANHAHSRGGARGAPPTGRAAPIACLGFSAGARRVIARGGPGAACVCSSGGRAVRGGARRGGTAPRGQASRRAFEWRTAAHAGAPAACSGRGKHAVVQHTTARHHSLSLIQRQSPRTVSRGYSTPGERRSVRHAHMRPARPLHEPRAPASQRATRARRAFQRVCADDVGVRLCLQTAPTRRRPPRGLWRVRGWCSAARDRAIDGRRRWLRCQGYRASPTVADLQYSTARRSGGNHCTVVRAGTTRPDSFDQLLAPERAVYGGAPSAA